MKGEIHSDIAEILLVEDSQADIRFALEALKETTIRANTSIKRNGEEAINYLKDLVKSDGRPKPKMILLDLNLPKKTGHEVLEFIKTQKSLKDVFVAVLTSAQNEEDILRAYKNNAKGYLIKKVDYKELAKDLQDLWGFVLLKRKKLHIASKFKHSK
jgi:chemotaxis family two-component system response regulator Rcp1